MRKTIQFKDMIQLDNRSKTIKEAVHEFKKKFLHLPKFGDAEIKNAIDFINLNCSDENQIYYFFYLLVVGNFPNEFANELTIIRLLDESKFDKIIQKNINRRPNYLDLQDEVSHTILWWALVNSYAKIAIKLIFFGANYIEDIDDVFFMNSKRVGKCYVLVQIFREIFQPNPEIKNNISVHLHAKAIQFGRSDIKAKFTVSSEHENVIKKLNLEFAQLFLSTNLSNKEYVFRQKMDNLCRTHSRDIVFIAINRSTFYGEFLLCEAVTYLRPDVVKILINYGATCWNRQFQFNLERDEDVTEEKQSLIVETMKVLMNNSADLNENFGNDDQLLEIATKCKSHILKEYLEQLNTSNE